MGMFDTLHAPCPRCGELNSEQTKAGDCILADYFIDDDRASNLFDGQDFYCSNCGTHYETINVNKPVIISRQIYRNLEDE